MRTRLAILAIGFGLMLVAPIGAQQPAASSFFTGVNPQTITMTPVDTSKFASQFNLSSAILTPSQPKPSTLTNFFHSFASILSWPPKLGTSIFPSTAATPQMPTFPNLTSANLPTMQVQPNQALMPF
jgi:hypothetical protein